MPRIGKANTRSQVSQPPAKAAAAIEWHAAHFLSTASPATASPAAKVGWAATASSNAPTSRTRRATGKPSSAKQR